MADYRADLIAEKVTADAVRDAVQALLDLKRYAAAPQNIARAEKYRVHTERAHAAATQRLMESERAIRESGGTRPGHPTQYVLSLPAVHYVHPLYGLHALSEPHRATVETAGLEGDGLATFTAFMREFPARGRWPLYAPHARDGLQKAGSSPLGTRARAVFDRLLSAHPGSIPAVHVAKVAPELLETA